MVIYRNLKIYQKALDLGKQVYKLTATLPREEQYGLSSQLKRASISVFSNIAEGASRDTKKDLSRFLTISIGSLTEVQAQLEFATMLGYISKEQFLTINKDIIELRKMISAYKARL